MSRPRVREIFSRERVWRLQSVITGVIGAMVAKKVIRAAYRVIRRQSPESVFDRDSVRFSWPEFVVWAVAGGIGLGIAKLMSNRVAAVGWKIATGTPPPKGDEQQTQG